VSLRAPSSKVGRGVAYWHKRNVGHLDSIKVLRVFSAKHQSCSSGMGSSSRLDWNGTSTCRVSLTISAWINVAPAASNNDLACSPRSAASRKRGIVFTISESVGSKHDCRETQYADKKAENVELQISRKRSTPRILGNIQLLECLA